MTRASKSRLDRRKSEKGRPPVPIEHDPQRFEIACWWAFGHLGYGPFSASRLALLAVEGGPITVEDVEGFFRQASAQIPLPPDNPDERDMGLRRLAAKAKKQRPTGWLVQSATLVRGLIEFVRNNNVSGTCTALDGLLALGWGPVISGLTERIETALKSNLPPADLRSLGPAARRLLAATRKRKMIGRI
jgi:hypothetical protein